MNFKKIGILFISIFTILIETGFAQGEGETPEKVTRYKGKISQQFALNKESVIVDQATGKRISYESYDAILIKSPGKYRTQPIFDEYGRPSSFALIRKKTQDFADNGAIITNPDLMPEVGEELPPFIMRGLDGREYNSKKLRGKYVLLGFWVKFEKPLYTLASTKVISSFIDEHKRRGIDIVSLGTTLNTEEECREAIPKRNCGFVPVPDSYGFNHRYKVAETPYFILLDKNGIVKAMSPHTEFAATIGELRLN